jgi:hypothetical protein
MVYRRGFSRAKTVQTLAELMRAEAPPDVTVVQHEA